jgi:hypothetical protein
MRAGLKILLIGLLAAGAAYWWGLFGPKSLGSAALGGIILAAVVAFIPSLQKQVDGWVDRLNGMMRPRRRTVTLLAALAMAAYLLALAWCSRDRLFLKLNDEHAYMIQARMLARGRLWMPPYPPEISPFFDALGLIVDRVYAAMYFPGTALAMAPLVWLGLAFWLMPLAAASVAAGFLYRVFAEMFDPVRGLLAVVMLAAIEPLRESSLLLLSECPFLAAEMVLLWAWLRFRGRPTTRYALVIGLAAGYAAITRPLDAVCVVLPIALAMVGQWRQLVRFGVIVVLGAIPFLALLAVQSRGVTGHWFELAEVYYNRENFPASPLGFSRISEIPSELSAPKRQWLSDWVIPSFERHTAGNALRTWYRGRLEQTLRWALPNPVLLILLPAALLSVGETRRRVMGGILVLFLVGYAVYLFFLEHYVVSILPAIICLIFMGWESLRRAWPRLNSFLLISLLMISLVALWPMTPLPPVDASFAPDQRAANAALAHLPKTPVVVLFRFDPRVESFHDDPVYNDGVAWPDDSPIVRANDLGPQRNRDILRYYAGREPERFLYGYDPDARAAGKYPLTYLGKITGKAP